MDNKANIKVQITEFITNTFPLARRRESIDDDSLLESGVVDSFGILEIVGFLEKNFHITIEDEELVPDIAVQNNLKIKYCL